MTATRPAPAITFAPEVKGSPWCAFCAAHVDEHDPVTGQCPHQLNRPPP